MTSKTGRAFASVACVIVCVLAAACSGGATAVAEEVGASDRSRAAPSVVATEAAATCAAADRGEPLGPMCSRKVTVASFGVTRASCYVDTEVGHGAEGTLRVPCEGDGEATLTFGSMTFHGSIAGGRLDVCAGTEFLWEDGCVWTSAQRVSGSVADGVLVFARDGNLFVTTGERSISEGRKQAQLMSSAFGKIVRITPDGKPAPGNPFVGREGALPEIFSLGHRNVQAAALHPTTGELWIVDHGARGGDEINVVRAGKNYGWPVISYGVEYAGGKIGEGLTQREGMEQPLYYWDPSIAPSGMMFYTGDAFPAWKGNAFVGALVLRHLQRLELDGDKVVKEERLLTDLKERIRDVRQAPDGSIWVVTDSRDARILRLSPAN